MHIGLLTMIPGRLARTAELLTSLNGVCILGKETDLSTRMRRHEDDRVVAGGWVHAAVPAACKRVEFTLQFYCS